MGASDSSAEGDWKWVTGPENGTSFWSGAGDGSTIGGMYANWNAGEPNDSGGNEDCAQFYVSTGKWNDLPCGFSLDGYVVEFGAPGDMPSVAAADISITIHAPLVATSFSPADNATGVAVNANLSIEFNRTVATSTGDISIRKTADDSLVEAIDVEDARITGGGTDTITINPSNLAESTEYYITIPGTSFVDTNGLFYAGIIASTTWSFTTGDFTAPTPSTISAEVGEDMATITWGTIESASSKVTYGVTSSYGTTTTESNTSPRVIEHEASLFGLLSCTMYHYAVVSTDGSSNTATSTDKTFITTGCDGGTTPTSATSTSITSSAGGSASTIDNGKTFTVIAPADATATSSAFVIQIKPVPNTHVLNTLGRPSVTSSEVGSTVFDVKVIINGDTVLDSFDTEITIEYEYTNDEISDIDESTLWLYHYTDGQWVALNECTVDTGANTISCTTPSFSIFGLFGSETEAESTGSRATGGIHFGCKDINASNYDYFSAHKQELCEYETPKQALQRIVNEHRNLLMQAYEAGITIPQNILDMLGVADRQLTVRDLEYGMEGEDVHILQKLLITQGYTIPAGTTGFFGLQTQYALDTYQLDNNIAPRGGYFGPITRAQMKVAGLAGLWW